MTSFILVPEEFATFSDALNNASAPSAKLRMLMREAVNLWNEEVDRGVTDDECEFIERLS